MISLGIYEQIINQLFDEKLASIDRTRFYIGERNVERKEVAKLLSMYLSTIFEQVFSNITDVCADDEDDETDEKNVTLVQRGIEVANSIIKKTGE